jgi:hypothetical protein
VSAALKHIRIIKNVGRKLRMMVISHIYEPRNEILYEMDYLVMMAKVKKKTLEPVRDAGARCEEGI